MSNKLITNINWEKDINGIRKLEIDSLSSNNSRTVNIGSQSLYYAISGSGSNSLTGNPGAYSPYFLVRKRTIKMIEIWNNILNCGLFNTIKYENSSYVHESQFFGSGLRSYPVEYLFKNGNGDIGLKYAGTSFIIPRVIKFICMNVKNYNNYVAATTKFTSSSFFTTNSGTAVESLSTYINTNFNPTDNIALTHKRGLWNLLEELFKLVKDIIDEEKLASEYLVSFEQLDVTTELGREKILLIENLNWMKIVKIVPYIKDLSLNDSVLKSIIDSRTSGTLQQYAYPFISPIVRNSNQEAWNIRNVLLNTRNYYDTEMSETYQFKYPNQIAMSQLHMLKPLVIQSEQYIDWNNENDLPYIISYNGWASIYIPDSIKIPELVDIQPDNQLNLCCNIWKIGTSNKLHPKYDPLADIKLNFGDDLPSKLNYFDNLTLHLKINK